MPVEQQAGSPFAYPLINIGEQFAIKDCLITDCITEPLVESARLTLVFEGKGLYSSPIVITGHGCRSTGRESLPDQ